MSAGETITARISIENEVNDEQGNFDGAADP